MPCWDEVQSCPASLLSKTRQPSVLDPAVPISRTTVFVAAMVADKVR